MFVRAPVFGAVTPSMNGVPSAKSGNRRLAPVVKGMGPLESKVRLAASTELGTMNDCTR
jgi:hypothetical protein